MSQIAIRVTPRSSKPGIGGWRTGADSREELEVRVAAPPADGAANAAVIELLAKVLGVSRSQVTVISGHSSRHKRVETGLAAEEIRSRLGDLA
jgi:uncharacterized protein (TIGR00251 family)